MRVPFADLKAQYDSIKKEIDHAFGQVLASSSFIGGKFVAAFEQEFAAYLGTKHCIGCANGTDAIEILLHAFGIGEGDEVIVPALTWISTAEAVNNTGATPVFIDIHPDTYTIDPLLIAGKITARTKAIIPVHLFGQAADMEEITRVAHQHNLIVIEDCAQSHGALYKNKITGTLAHAATFSFYPGKNLGAYGDAGAMVTNDDRIAEKARMIANHGQKEKHDHRLIGRNSRLDGLQAAVLSVKLRYLDRWNEARVVHAALYNSLLHDLPVKKPVTVPDRKHVFHLYVIECGYRDARAKLLEKDGIQTAVHYPRPLPFTDAYKHLNIPEHEFPVSLAACSRILSLPMYAELDKEKITYTCSCLARHIHV